MSTRRLTCLFCYKNIFSNYIFFSYYFFETQRMQNTVHFLIIFLRCLFSNYLLTCYRDTTRAVVEFSRHAFSWNTIAKDQRKIIQRYENRPLENRSEKHRLCSAQKHVNVKEIFGHRSRAPRVVMRFSWFWNGRPCRAILTRLRTVRRISTDGHHSGLAPYVLNTTTVARMYRRTERRCGVCLGIPIFRSI